MVLGALGMQELFAKSLSDLRQAVTALQTKARCQEAKIADIDNQLRSAKLAPADFADRGTGARAQSLTPRSHKQARTPRQGSGSIASSIEKEAHYNTASPRREDGRLRLMEELVGALSARVDLLEDVRRQSLDDGFAASQADQALALQIESSAERRLLKVETTLESCHREVLHRMRLIEADNLHRTELHDRDLETMVESRHRQLRDSLRSSEERGLSMERKVNDHEVQLRSYKSEASLVESKTFDHEAQLLHVFSSHTKLHGKFEELRAEVLANETSCEERIERNAFSNEDRFKRIESHASEHACTEQHLAAKMQRVDSTSQHAKMIAAEVKSNCSRLESQVVAIEEGLTKHERLAAESESRLRVELGRSLKQARVDATRTESALEARMDGLFNNASQLSTSLMGGRKASIQSGFALAAPGCSDAEFQLATMVSNIRSCTDEQERLARHAIDMDTLLRELKSDMGASQACAESSLSKVEMRIDAMASELDSSKNDDTAHRIKSLEKRVGHLTTEHSLAEQELTEQVLASHSKLKSRVAAVEGRIGDLLSEHSLSEQAWANQSKLKHSVVTLEGRIGDLMSEQSLAEYAITQQRKAAASFLAIEGHVEQLERSEQRVCERLDGTITCVANLSKQIVSTEQSLANTEQNTCTIPRLEDRVESLTTCQLANQRDLAQQQNLASELASLERRLSQQHAEPHNFSKLEAQITSMMAEHGSIEQRLAEVDCKLMSSRASTLLDNNNMWAGVRVQFSSEIAEAKQHALSAEDMSQRAEVACHKMEEHFGAIKADGNAHATQLESRVEHEARKAKSLANYAEVAALRSADSLRAELRSFGECVEQEARDAKKLACHAEASVQLFRREEKETARRLTPNDADMTDRLARRAESAVSQLRHDIVSQEQKLDQNILQIRQELTILDQSCRDASERREGIRNDLATAVNSLQAELQSHNAPNLEPAACIRNELEQTNSRLKGQLNENVADLKADIAEMSGKFRSELSESCNHLEEKLNHLRSQVVRDVGEQLMRVGEQLASVEDRLTPLALQGLLRNVVDEAARDAVAGELKDLRVGWCQSADYKFDCTFQCLHALYLKVGLSPAGALTALQRTVRDNSGGSSSARGHSFATVGSGSGRAASRSRRLEDDSAHRRSIDWSETMGVPGGPGIAGGPPPAAASSFGASPRRRVASPALGGAMTRRDFSMIE